MFYKWENGLMGELLPELGYLLVLCGKTSLLFKEIGIFSWEICRF